MTAKRAFIVDDSRSARVILGRMLESYGMQVDSAESAEQALEYLKHSRPDVVFMDHLMPGMDGFQAIQAIKSNPDTATIPVVMYTSQEGELYVSQARALGAVGVLPKTVKQADVSRVLYQLRLLAERREAKSQLITPVSDGAAAQVRHEASATSSIGELEMAVRRAMAPALKEHTSELRRFYLASFEAFARRLTAEIKSASGAAPAAPAPASPTETQTTETPHPPEPTTRWPWLATAAVLALVPTVVLGTLLWRSQDTNRLLNDSYAGVTATLERQQAQLASLQKSLESQPTQAAGALANEEAAEALEPEGVPYGEVPLSGARVERLRMLVDELRAREFQGKILMRTYVGDFCLTGNGVEGFSVAAEDLQLKRCDVIGNPYDDGLSQAQRQSLAFANLVSSLRQHAAGITVEITHEGRKPAIPYPPTERLGRLNAGDWNRIAAQNNRVEFSVESTP